MYNMVYVMASTKEITSKLCIYMLYDTMDTQFCISRIHWCVIQIEMNDIVVGFYSKGTNRIDYHCLLEGITDV